MAKTVIGLFDNLAVAQAALRELAEAASPSRTSASWPIRGIRCRAPPT
jgi:hypothetical protein